MHLRFYNTLTKRIDAFTPIDSSYVRVYSCGPTVYDVAHIGNMRAFLFPDLLQRVLRVVGGYDVKWVMNVTDVDDKTIADSQLGSKRWLEGMGDQTADPRVNLSTYTQYYEAEFLEDLNSFNIKREHFFAVPRATDYIVQMQSLIEQIIDAGFGYISDGSVYFNVAAYRQKHEYGRLFAIDTANFREGVRIDADEYDRESVSDFVLWKEQKSSEPSWDFVIDGVNLPGRPGWHIECSAMSKELLGVPFDIHTGGVDLRFPHHEDELAQCCAGYKVQDQAAFWMHNEFLEVEGRKMSKSLGNFFTLRDLVLKGLHPLDIRFAMLQAHYRTVYNFTFEGIKAASVARKKIQEYVYDVKDLAGGSAASGNDGDMLRAAVFKELAADVHTPKALAELFSFVGEHPVSSLDPSRAASIFSSLVEINSVFDVFSTAYRPVMEIPDVVVQLAARRWDAKTSKDWAESDRLRAEITALGWAMNDGKESYTLEPLQ